MSKKISIIVLVGIVCFILFTVWSTTFLFVIQPIGAVPKGATVWLFKPDRLLTEKSIPFICSADGLMLDLTGKVNLFGRGIMIAFIAKHSKKIIKFPYSHTLYLISTGGIEFER